MFILDLKNNNHGAVTITGQLHVLCIKNTLHNYEKQFEDCSIMYIE